MICHENRLLADGSHEISYLIFFFKLGKMSQNFSSVAVVIDALRVKYGKVHGLIRREEESNACWYITEMNLSIYFIYYENYGKYCNMRI